MHGTVVCTVVVVVVMYCCVERGAGQLYPSLAKDCYDPVEPFRRSPLIRFPNGTSIDPSRVPPVEPVRPATAAGSQLQQQLASSRPLLTVDANNSYKIGQRVRSAFI